MTQDVATITCYLLSIMLLEVISFECLTVNGIINSQLVASISFSLAAVRFVFCSSMRESITPRAASSGAVVNRLAGYTDEPHCGCCGEIHQRENNKQKIDQRQAKKRLIDLAFALVSPKNK